MALVIILLTVGLLPLLLLAMFAPSPLVRQRAWLLLMATTIVGWAGALVWALTV
jgi:hypothetical protein